MWLHDNFYYMTVVSLCVWIVILTVKQKKKFRHSIVSKSLLKFSKCVTSIINQGLKVLKFWLHHAMIKWLGVQNSFIIRKLKSFNNDNICN